MSAPLTPRNSFARWVTLVLPALVITTASLADTIDIAAAQSYVENLRKRLHLPGLSVAVAIHGEIVWSQGFGFADVDNGVPVAPETVFRIASVSKVLTAGGVARLYDQGKLDVDADVRDYVPEFPDKGHVITTRQLLSHLSGIRHYGFDEGRPQKHYSSVIEALELFKEDPLLFEPGATTAYSSYGWVLVSAVMERAAHVSFATYMQDQVFAPTGMRETYLADSVEGASQVALLYDGETLAVPENLSSVLAAGGFSSTATDLAHYGSAVMADDDFLSPKTRQWMFERQKTNDGEEGRYGVGWIVDALEDGKPIYHHGGNLTGSQSLLFLNPEAGVVVAMLANKSSSFGANEANLVACHLLGIEGCLKVVGETAQMRMIMSVVRDLQSALNDWELAVRGGDLEAVGLILSDEFASSTWGGRSGLERTVGEGIVGQHVKVDTENAHLRIATFHIGSRARVEDIDVQMDGEAEQWLLVFVLGTDGWKIAEWERQ
ncbi:MAG: beta-lactamase family protein [Candidatus Krumholzibacteriota bacterium]|nr:beta-lactamase family protein [Candidatus Krumholzibacteriota bacterium]